VDHHLSPKHLSHQRDKSYHKSLVKCDGEKKNKRRHIKTTKQTNNINKYKTYHSTMQAARLTTSLAPIRSSLFTAVRNGSGHHGPPKAGDVSDFLFIHLFLILLVRLSNGE